MYGTPPPPTSPSVLFAHSAVLSIDLYRARQSLLTFAPTARSPPAPVLGFTSWVAVCVLPSSSLYWYVIFGTTYIASLQ